MNRTHEEQHEADAAQEWELLAELLREELAEYGEFVVLLDEQQRAILQHDAEALKELDEAIQHQIIATQQVRDRRTDLVATLADIWSLDRNASVRQLLPCFPEAAQPMIEALVNEINSLIGRTRKSLKQNHMLLSRATEVAEKILTALNPRPTTKTYERSGSVSFKTSSVGSCIRTTA